ncbi:MAG: winged helix-turn-helix domain-containing protein [Clostridia bacterium]|nr:winged helix-turn-helix domain-containing protein [Clostridia bacterium]
MASRRRRCAQKRAKNQNDVNDMEKAIKLDKLKKIDETSAKVFKALSEELGDASKHVSYTAIAARLKLSRNAVRYAVDRMIADGLVQCKDGELSVAEVLVTVG